MKECQNCGANIEELLYRCDCCGAMLSNENPLFVQYSHTMAETGDLSSYMKDILDSLNASQLEKFFQLNRIAFEMYCYPKDMILKFGIKTKNYVSLRQEKAILTRVICYEEFVTMSSCQKRAILSEVIKNSLLELCNKINKQDMKKLKIKIEAIL